MEENLKNLKRSCTEGLQARKSSSGVIKSQFGKSIYGEVVDKILRETTNKVIDEKIKSCWSTKN